MVAEKKRLISRKVVLAFVLTITLIAIGLADIYYYSYPLFGAREISYGKDYEKVIASNGRYGFADRNEYNRASRDCARRYVSIPVFNEHGKVIGRYELGYEHLWVGQFCKQLLF